jgi:hypothetical protein
MKKRMEPTTFSNTPTSTFQKKRTSNPQPLNKWEHLNNNNTLYQNQSRSSQKIYFISITSALTYPLSTTNSSVTSQLSTIPRPAKSRNSWLRSGQFSKERKFTIRLHTMQVKRFLMWFFLARIVHFPNVARWRCTSSLPRTSVAKLFAWRISAPSTH